MDENEIDDDEFTPYNLCRGLTAADFDVRRGSGLRRAFEESARDGRIDVPGSEAAAAGCHCWCHRAAGYEQPASREARAWLKIGVDASSPGFGRAPRVGDTVVLKEADEPEETGADGCKAAVVGFLTAWERDYATVLHCTGGGGIRENTFTRRRVLGVRRVAQPAEDRWPCKYCGRLAEVGTTCNRCLGLREGKAAAEAAEL